MSGYYRYPTIHNDTLVFCAEDDLWSVPVAGGVARRLTTSLGAVSTPCLSPDGRLLAFAGRDEGAWEVYVMPAEGGAATRLTYQGAMAQVVGWSRDAKQVYYSSEADGAFSRSRQVWAISSQGGAPKVLPWGLASHISEGPRGGLVLGRNTGDPARWKRYRGGTAGQLWIDRSGNGTFVRLQATSGNVAAPLWIGKRIYFLSDHEGVGNLYSCTPTGKGVQRHTHHEEFYARNATTDGRRIVYHAGGDCYCFDLKSDTMTKIQIALASPQVQRRRRFVSALSYLQGYTLRPDGKAVGITARGSLYTMGNWEGPVLPHGQDGGSRARLCTWLNDGNRMVMVSDCSGEERLEIVDTTGRRKAKSLDRIAIGHAMGLAVSPKADCAVVQNHRFELILADLKKGTGKVIDKSDYAPITGMAWSADGKWIVYSVAVTSRTRIIRLYHVGTGKKHAVTRPEFNDVAPSWDPEGKYLYFISYRAYNPVYDALHFDLGFPQAMQLMVVPLRKDVPSPFVARLEDSSVEKKGDAKKKGKEAPMKIDVAGLPERVLSFPKGAGRYGRIVGIKGKILYSQYGVKGTLVTHGPPAASQGTVFAYDLATMKEETILTGVDSFSVSRDGSALLYRSGKRLRVVKAGEKPSEQKSNGLVKDGGRATGWINLDRVSVSVDPPSEWRQMFREAWRLQRDYFWDENMSGVDWARVYKRYAPLLDRIGCRSELSDLVWEMQGELGTSHAYEMGGDYRIAPRMPEGKLGADFAWDGKHKGYRVTAVVSGDSWEEQRHSPLLAPGVNIAKGDVLSAINGVLLTKGHTPGHGLVNQAGREVALRIQSKSGAERDVVVRALRSETALRYRDWVNRNRELVHRRSKGQVGYVHIPDMGPNGYAEFHRGWLPELHYPALIIDVRFNGGGHVSQLLLEKLARKRLGYDVPRWHPPEAYPTESVLGPMVALTNENAGSDGDIFSHCFKRMDLGPLIGTRTWGGVIGINPCMELVDGSVTTQPEYSFWFDDVAWGVENYGTDPDVEVFIAPQDYKASRDPQLDAGLKAILDLMKKDPPKVPTFHKRPTRKLPRLPKG